MIQLVLAAVAFLGAHWLLSHPLRATLVARIGDRGFLILYSLVAFLTLGWMAHAYARTPAQAPLWGVGDGLWAIGTAAMWIGAVLFVGALRGNPALPGASPDGPARPRGVFAITRHPMMWGFALWSLTHAIVFPVPANLVLTAAIALLALGGAAMQDAKKARLMPDFWPRWMRVTSFWPFGALIRGDAQWAAAWPGTLAIVGGTILWLAATYAHIPAVGILAGPWRWIAG